MLVLGPADGVVAKGLTVDGPSGFVLGDERRVSQLRPVGAAQAGIAVLAHGRQQTLSVLVPFAVLPNMTA